MPNAVERKTYGPLEVAALLGVSKTLVYDLINQQRIRAIRVSPKRLVVPREEIDRLLDLEAI